MDLERKVHVFRSNFAKEVEEKLILTSEAVDGAKYWEKKLWKPWAGFIASVDLATGETVKQEGFLTWLADESEKDGWIYNLQPFTIYHVKCRKTLEKANPIESLRWTNKYMLVDVVERNLHHPELEQILKEYEQPEEAVESFGRFSLERQFDWFSGSVNWLGKKCKVSLKCDEEGKYTVRKALEVFREIYANLAEWDDEIRNFAADKLSGLANEWQVDFDEDLGENQSCFITKEAFAKRICISEFDVFPNGFYTAYYNADNIFLGHTIMIQGNINEGMKNAKITG